MAGTVKGIIVEIGGDTSGLQKALSKINSASSGLSKELRGINSLLKLDPSNTTLVAQKQKVLAENIATTEEKLKSLKEAQKEADKIIAEGGEINQENYRSLQREIITTQNKLSALKAEASNWNKAGDALIKYGERITAISEKVETLGTNLTTKITLPLVALAGGMAATTANFEDSMRQVAATMGITADEIENGSESYKVLEEAAQKCGETTKYSASEAADALNYLALAGYDAKKSAEVLPKVLNLAAAGNLDLATASDMVTDAMAALNMETKDLDKYINEMAKTSQKSNTSVAQLGEATLTCAGTVNLAGMSLETMNTELGILANNGIKGAEGGTHLRNIILSLTSPTDKAAVALETMGLKVHDSEGNIRDLNDIMIDLNGILDGLTDGEKTNIISTIFNKTDISAVNALIKGSGEEFSSLKSQISNCEGAAQDMADTMNSSLKGQLTLLKSQIEGISIKMGNKMMPTVKKAVKQVSGLADKFSELSDEQVETILKTAGFVAAVGPALTILGKLGTKLGSGITTLGNFSKAIGNVKNGVKTAEGQVGTFTTILSKLISPAGLATTAITALTLATVAYAKKQADEIYGLNGITDSIDKQQESWQKLKEAREEQLNNSAIEISNLQNLKDELSKITDENGKVKDGYKDRANVILNELNSALGTEIKLNGDAIDSYRNVQEEIQKLIDKKKADALLSAYADEYGEAVKKQADATENLVKLKQQLSDEEVNLIKLSGKDRAEAELRISAISNQIKKESGQISQYGYTIQNYENLQKASVNGSAEAIARATEQMGVSWDRAKEKTGQSLQEQITSQQEYVNALKLSLQDAQTANDEYQAYIIQKQLDSANERLTNLQNELTTTSTTIDTNTAIQTAAENLGNRSTTLYNGEISQLRPLTDKQLENIKNGLDVNTSVQTSTGMIAQRATSHFAEHNKMSSKMQEEINATATVENLDTTIGSGASRLASEANTNFNNNVNGHKWGSDLTDNISSGIISKIASVASAAARVAGTIASYLHHSVPDKGPLADELTYMPDMIDNLTRTLLKSSPKLEKASFEVAKKMASNLDLSKYQSTLSAKVIDSTKTVFTTPQIVFNVQELDEAKLQQCFNYINKKFGSAY